MDQQVDVVVVGAGPVGLLAAIELTLGGVRVLVLERLAAASLDMKAGGLGPLGLEALERRGMAGAIAAAEARSFASLARRPGPTRGPKKQSTVAISRASPWSERTRRRSRIGVHARWISRPSKPCWPTARTPWASRCAENAMSQASSSRRTESTWNGGLRQVQSMFAAPTSSDATGGVASSARWPALTSRARSHRRPSTKPSPRSTIPNAWRPWDGGAHREGCSPTDRSQIGRAHV